jgi:uncharacterized protein
MSSAILEIEPGRARSGATGDSRRAHGTPAPPIAARFPTGAPALAASRQMKCLTLQVAQTCNLRCAYCSADFGRYGGPFRNMSIETARDAVDFLFDNSESPTLAINYFGGEPLLNLPVVLASAGYALDRAASAARQLHLHLVTNGVRLDDPALRALDALGFSLTVSLDGTGDYHDRVRPSADGQGSHQRTVSGLRRAACLPIGQRVTIRGTFCRPTAAFFPQVRFLVEEGLARNISYEPAFLPHSHSLALRWKDLPDIRRAYVQLADYYVSRVQQGSAFCFWDFDDAITQLSSGRSRSRHCGAGATTAAVTAEGDLYGCHMSTGLAGARIGSIRGGVQEAVQNRWQSVHRSGRPGCHRCWLRAHCGGGCNTHALMFRGTLDQPYSLECRFIEWRFRMAIWIMSRCPELRGIPGRRGGDSSDGGHVTVPLWSLLTQERPEKPRSEPEDPLRGHPRVP